ncbi:MAG: L-rhamnose mutarotase [Verrucomicrobia bacterium]|nr:L-rhamnose mutarotase [Verrucomicrobiota bacterium]
MKSAKQPKKAQVIRRAFTLRLKPGSFAKYKHYHNHIWPELVREIQRCGIAQITTFQDDLQLFLYSEIYDQAAWDKLWSSKIHDRWAELMEPLMQFRPDGKVDAGPLREIFHLETAAGQRKRESKFK